MWITFFGERKVYMAKDGGEVTSLLLTCAVSSKTQEEGKEGGKEREEEAGNRERNRERMGEDAQQVVPVAPSITLPKS